MDDQYLIPANANRGKLILGYFRGIDLIIFSSGVIVSFILLLIFQNEMHNTWVAVATLIPAGICTLLVLPIPYQHNVLVVLQAMYRFYFVNQQKFKWKGWCFLDGNKK